MPVPIADPRRALAALLVALPLAAAAADALDARAAWRPGPGFLPGVRQQCASAERGRYGECLVGRMAAAGASAQAVDFSARLLRETGQTGIAREVRSAGPIAIVVVDYPLRANQNEGWLLVDAQGQLIDVDDPDLRPWEGLAHDPTYRALLQAHPRLAIFPGERGSAGGVAVEPLPDGGRRVVARYRLTDSCHACAYLGSASIGFDFDAGGSFAGPTLLGVEGLR